MLICRRRHPPQLFVDRLVLTWVKVDAKLDIVSMPVTSEASKRFSCLDHFGLLTLLIGSLWL